MSRGLSSGMQTAAAATTVRPAILGYFDFASDVVRIWTGVGSLSWGGNTYLGMGDFLSIERVIEAATSGQIHSRCSSPASPLRGSLTRWRRNTAAGMRSSGSRSSIAR